MSNYKLSVFSPGRSFLVTTHRALVQCLESLVQKIQVGVVVNFDKVITEGIETNTNDSFHGTDN
jgi:copper homeostasis protein CutC